MTVMQRGPSLSTSATVRRRLAGLADDPDFVHSLLLQVEMARAEIRAERRAPRRTSQSWS